MKLSAVRCGIAVLAACALMVPAVVGQASAGHAVAGQAVTGQAVTGQAVVSAAAGRAPEAAVESTGGLSGGVSGSPDRGATDTPTAEVPADEAPTDGPTTEPSEPAEPTEPAEVPNPARPENPEPPENPANRRVPAAATTASGAAPTSAQRAIAAAAKVHAARLGPASGQIRCGITGGGCYQHFRTGSIHWSPATGAHPTWGAIRTAWQRTGWEAGKLGYPVSAERCGLPAGGCYQSFAKGSVHWSPATGAQPTWGAIRTEWQRTGWERGVLGYPTSGERCGIRAGGCYQHFQRGSIHWSPATGAHATWGTIHDMWSRAGWETGRYGYPTGRPSLGDDGKVRQRFEKATITTGVVTSGLPYGVKPDGGRQLLIAHTAQRSSTTGTAELWELRGDLRWHRAHSFSGARFGYRGLATGAAKREGDGKTPMGQYRIPFAFGTAGKPAGTRIDYRRVDGNDQWCSRPGSKHYNQWMSAPNADCPAKHAEVLSKFAQYRYAAVVDYNAARTPGRGSAIFVHVHGKGSTAGCVSVTAGQMQTLLRWLRPEQTPRIVIAPHGELKNQ